MSHSGKEINAEPTLEEKLNQIPPLQNVRVRYSLIGVLIGLAVFLIGARPDFIGMDQSPVIGFIQISVMIVGLGIICLTGYWSVHILWRRQVPSITADFGMRFISTGYVIAVFSGLADVFGIGSHPLPGVPVFGMWQARGMEIGLGIIAIGFIMMFPYTQKKH